MTLTRRDLAATLFVALATLTLVAALADWGVPLIGDSNRWAALVVLVLGFAGYLSGDPLEGRREPVLGVLGIVALSLAIIALATGSSVFLALLVADILVLWAATTVRHSQAHGRGSVRTQS
jgi:hypothetical protein